MFIEICILIRRLPRTNGQKKVRTQSCLEYGISVTSRQGRLCSLSLLDIFYVLISCGTCAPDAAESFAFPKIVAAELEQDSGNLAETHVRHTSADPVWRKWMDYESAKEVGAANPNQKRNSLMTRLLDIWMHFVEALWRIWIEVLRTRCHLQSVWSCRTVRLPRILSWIQLGIQIHISAAACAVLRGQWGVWIQMRWSTLWLSLSLCRQWYLIKIE